MKKKQEYADHPRLYLDSEAMAACRRKPRLHFLKEAQRRVEHDARVALQSKAIEYDAGRHNALLMRARKMQDEVITLLVRWLQTGRAVYKDAVMERVRRMDRWEYWSWIAWRAGDRARDAIFDLSYGENSTTLAVAYDLLYETLTKDERADCVAAARRWAFASGKKHCRPGAGWWFGKPDSNWNTVCAGGLGMLCLAMADDAPEAPAILERADESVHPFMLELDKTKGGWPEGIGYWNYGMRYAFMYLMSWENATGRRHPLLRRSNTKRTLAFPLDFCPHGQACSFGDSNHWAPHPFHVAVATRLGMSDLRARLDERVSPEALSRASSWPDAAEWLALHPGKKTRVTPKRNVSRGGVRLYSGLDWAVIADDFEKPHLYASVRGGTTEVPHGQRDLLSFHVVVDDERLITNMRGGEYLDTTFSPRRNELPEMAPGTKNTILVNGVGIDVKTALDRTSVVRGPGVEGVRMDATTAMGRSRGGKVAVTFCGRSVLLLDRRALLILDRIELPYAGRVESRLHAYGDVRVFRAGCVIRGKRQRVRGAFDADEEAVLAIANPAPTDPTHPVPTMLRWCSKGRDGKTYTLATLLVPGSGAATVSVERWGRGLRIQAATRNWSKTVNLTRRLGIAKA